MHASCACCCMLQVEGTCSPKHGYILAVLKVDDISKVSSDCIGTASCSGAALSSSCRHLKQVPE